MIFYVLIILVVIIICAVIGMLANEDIKKKIIGVLVHWYLSLKPSAKCHLKTILQLSITLFLSLLPAILSALSKGSKDVHWFTVLIDDLKTGSVFIYAPAFLAQFFILTLTQDIKKESSFNFFYKLVLLMSWYSCFMGAITYAGFVDRGIFDFGEEVITLPSTVDWSIILTTLASWYYCTYKATYEPENPMKTYEKAENETRNKYDEVTENA